MNTQAERIRQYILQNLPHHPEDIVASTAQHFSVTRTTVHRHLTHLLNQGDIFKAGVTRNIRYRLKSSLDRQIPYKIVDGISEFTLFHNDFADLFQQFPENVYDLGCYAFTAIMNNAIKHSQGSQILVKTAFQQDDLIISISDNGHGLFQTLADYYNFAHLREAALHLSKGKVTSDPENHQGEGIFFSSRAFDRFEIYANHLHYIRDKNSHDWSLETIDGKMLGTTVHMTLSRHTPTKLIDLLKQYQYQEDASFSRTEVFVKMSQWGNEPLVSRDQANRVTRGLEQFQQIVLDFTDVRLVGQGFVDEVFRVFAKAHPEVVIDYVNANADVDFMIKRGLG
jgi:hypothetical protein